MNSVKRLFRIVIRRLFCGNLRIKAIRGSDIAAESITSEKVS